MLEITTKSGNELEVDEDLVIATRVEKSGKITRLYLRKPVPNPERSSQRPTNQLRVQGKPEELGIKELEKFEEENGAWIWLNMANLLAKTPTEKGFRAYVDGDLGSNTPFAKKSIELQEVG